MAFTYELATPGDEAELRSLLRRLPVPGSIELTYRREPDYFDGCAAHGHFCQTVVARTAGGGVTALACRAARRLYVNGRAESVGYLGQLRVAPGVNGLSVLLRGFEFFRQLHRQAPFDRYLTTIIAGNQKARRLLVESSRPSMPRYRSLGMIHTLTFPTRGKVSGEFNRGAQELVDYLQEHGPRKQFFPHLTVETLDGRTGPRPEDFVAIEGGVVAVWDQSAFKQTVVESYHQGISWLRPLLNGLVGGFPRPGAQLRMGYAACLCLEQPRAFEPLLRAALSRARGRGLDYLVLGLHQQDPLLPRAKKFFHIPYLSELFEVEFEPAERSLDERIPYLEIATL